MHSSPPATSISATTETALETFAAIAATPAPDLSDPAVAEFFDQFTFDVASLDDAQRSAFFAATSDQAFAVTQQIYVHDMAPRVRALLSATVGLDLPTASPSGGIDLWSQLEGFMATVARLDALDPALTEIVRLRGARLHDCAVCKSRRSRDALAAGATEGDFIALDDWPTSNLPAATKAALGLVDAMLLTPDQVPPAAIEAARRLLTPDQIVEVLLDVTRNAANKIAVALGADAAQVTDGVELFTTDRDGTVIVVGLARIPREY